MPEQPKPAEAYYDIWEEIQRMTQVFYPAAKTTGITVLPAVVVQEPKTPYPWCHGSPTKADCAARGYCNRDPNCGE
jgi:hypothetical protein